MSGCLQAEESSFTANLKYNSKKKKLKISVAVAKDVGAESSQTHQAVDDDRKMALQVGDYRRLQEIAGDVARARRVVEPPVEERGGGGGVAEELMRRRPDDMLPRVCVVSWLVPSFHHVRL